MNLKTQHNVEHMLPLPPTLTNDCECEILKEPLEK